MCYKPITLSTGVQVPCGHCEACQIQYNSDWTQRILDEFKAAGEKGCFITLTYNNENLPEDKQLRPDDLRLFLMRLRKSIYPTRFRYFATGEYGGKNNRPHYHAILFGYVPDDLVRFAENRFGSKKLERIWKKGFVSVGDINLKTARYCAKYLQKCDRRYHDVKPFCRMSNRPGIGASAVSPDMLLTGERYIEGHKFLVPRYYLRKLEQRGLSSAPLRAVRSQILDNQKPLDYNAFSKASDAKLNGFQV